MTVTFFGHGDAPQGVSDCLYEILEWLIRSENAENFYVGNHGNFDRFALHSLERLKRYYPHIRYTVVLAYMPRGRQNAFNEADTVLPFEVSSAPPRFAIDRRNAWMLKQSDAVVSYVVRPYGGAAKYKKMALLRGKRIIELSEKLRGTGVLK